MQKNNSSRVGKFDAGISGINQLGLRDILNYKSITRKDTSIRNMFRDAVIGSKKSGGKTAWLGVDKCRGNEIRFE